eukprot:gnl/TRDRNA2_/TRDRNA2_153825_c0_seq1.p2 gnl/TRDRNA2_/TRDRNA2_153825_c0~~gnl/TRDRNA2_/TRDRNA2_153825_c0_seq1.p2  ORF type:complete len:160 (-),score=35.75 gnl/TRDRNA2_/TRDRNA2_153825_c0_seq1:31-510(-)
MNNDQLMRVFSAYAGGPDMQSRTFVKCMKDAGVLDELVTLTDIDLIFTKSKVRGARTIDFQGFEHAMSLIAAKRGVEMADVEDILCNTAGPSYDNSVTIPLSSGAGPQRFYHDTSSYTGVWKKGGPDHMNSGVEVCGHHAERGTVRHFEQMQRRTPSRV